MEKAVFIPKTSILRRAQLQVSLNFQLLPDRHTSWREWIISPCLGITRPDELANKAKIPTDCDRSGGGLYIDHFGPTRSVRTNFWWAHAAFRLLGLDLGIGIYYQRQPR